MTRRRTILFTFDYELFLGRRSGTAEKCMLAPTEELLKIFAPYKVKALFFVDTTYLLRLKEIAVNYPAARDDFEKITRQLQQLVREGHYVSLHLHPHWRDATYLPESNQWDLSDTSCYRFHQLSPNEQADLFARSAALLKEIVAAADRNANVDAYRAGGWSIQPFADFAPCFDAAGIRYDFSVLPGFCQFSQAQHFDFRKVPAKPVYYFSADPVKEDAQGRYTEYTISSVRVPALHKTAEKFLLKYLWQTGDRYWGDGHAVASAVTENYRPEGGEMVSVEMLNLVKLPLYLRQLEQQEYQQFISHPKMLSRHNLAMLKRFLRKVFSRYEVQTDFKTIQPDHFL